jgi:hypothetical protein
MVCSTKKSKNLNFLVIVLNDSGDKKSSTHPFKSGFTAYGHSG